MVAQEEIVKTLESDYLMIKKRSWMYFLGGAVALPVLAGIIGYQASVTAVEDFFKKEAATNATKKIVTLQSQAENALSEITAKRDGSRKLSKEISGILEELRIEQVEQPKSIIFQGARNLVFGEKQRLFRFTGPSVGVATIFVSTTDKAQKAIGTYEFISGNGETIFRPMRKWVRQPIGHVIKQHVVESTDDSVYLSNHHRDSKRTDITRRLDATVRIQYQGALIETSANSGS